MVGCVALDCSNRSEKGFLLFPFPREKIRRKEWTHRCCRKNWEPTNYSKICEVHFESDQWENRRADGRRKLKPNATPSFCRKDAKKTIGSTVVEDESSHSLQDVTSHCRRQVENVTPYRRGRVEDITSRRRGKIVQISSSSRSKTSQLQEEINALKMRKENVRSLTENYLSIIKSTSSQPEHLIPLLKAEVEHSENLLKNYASIAAPEIVCNEPLTFVSKSVVDHIKVIKAEINADMNNITRDTKQMKCLLQNILRFFDLNLNEENIEGNVVPLMKNLYAAITVIVAEYRTLKFLLEKFLRYLEEGCSHNSQVSNIIGITNDIHSVIRIAAAKANLAGLESEYSKILNSNVVSVDIIPEKVKVDTETLQSYNRQLKSISEKLDSFLKFKFVNLSLDAVRIDSLEKKVESLEMQVKAYEEKVQNLSKIYNDDEVKKLSGDRIHEWSSESIMKGLKYRFGLGLRGYHFLTEQGHPLPGYSTLTHRLQSYKITNGIFSDLFEPLKKKAECLRPIDRCCSLMVDEIEIRSNMDYDKNENRFYGYKTIGSEENQKELGDHIVTVMIRGLAAQWKQIIAYEVTGAKTRASDMKMLIDDSIKFAESCGLYVVSMTSDMGGQNRKFWTSLGVTIQRHGIRKNHFYSNGHIVYVVADPPHLLKNLKTAMLKKTPLRIPEDIQHTYSLPCNEITGAWVKNLWDKECDANKEIRLLHHLNHEDLFPDNWNKMDVGPAVRFFSLKTAAALEEAVNRGLLHEDCKTTIWFIRKIEAWFTLVSSRLRKKSITKRNQHEKEVLLEEIIQIFENIEIGGTWKPLNAGMILSSLSLLDLSDYLFENGYDFVLLSRFAQDALENVFSQVRRKCGKTPTVLDCQGAFKLISLSQFSSDIRHTNYSTDADLFLIDFFSQKSKDDRAVVMSNNIYSIHSGAEDEEILDDFAEPFSTIEEIEDYSNLDAELVCFIAGSATNAILKKKTLCDLCRTFLKGNITNKYSRYIRTLNKGGLKLPNNTVLTLVLNIEIIYQKYRSYILHTNSNASLLEKIVDDLILEFPICCNLKYDIAKHFFVVRSYAVKNFYANTKKRKTMYGTSTAKKRKV